jgi:hypothetical protein
MTVRICARKKSAGRDLNVILDSKYVVMASADLKAGLDGWKEIAESLNFVSDQLESSGLKAGDHNHQREFIRFENQRPIEILAKNTKPSVMLQLDVGTCIEAGSDPVAWFRANPGRIRSLHLKDWSPQAAKARQIGKTFSRQRRASVRLSISSWSKKGVGFPNWTLPSGVFRIFASCIPPDRSTNHRQFHSSLPPCTSANSSSLTVSADSWAALDCG